MTDHILPIALSAAIPLRIAELKKRGGPTDRDIEMTRALANDLAAHGDILLYGGKKGEAASLFNQIAFAIAVMAFCPGGIKVFGEHWEADSTGDLLHVTRIDTMDK